MANRVTDAEVRAIIPTTTITDLTPFITSANVIVDKMVAGGCVSEGEQADQVELWLSAHFASVTDPNLSATEVKFENSSRKRAGTTGSGLMSSQYGQMANTLSNGCLAEYDKRNPSIEFLL